MKFYVYGVETCNDGSKTSSAIYPYDNQDEVIANFLSSWGGYEEFKSCACMVCCNV